MITETKVTSPEFLRATQIEAQFGIDAATVKRWAQRGLISGYKISSRLILFDPSEVREYVKSTLTPKRMTIDPAAHRG